MNEGMNGCEPEASTAIDRLLQSLICYFLFFQWKRRK